LLVHIKATFKEMKGAYGWPRIWCELVDHGVKGGKGSALGPCPARPVACAVRRLMREGGLQARGKRKFKATTNSAHDLPIAPNLLQGNVTAQAPNQVWTGDITYIGTQEGWLYLAVVIGCVFADLFAIVISPCGHEDILCRSLLHAAAHGLRIPVRRALLRAHRRD